MATTKAHAPKKVDFPRRGDIYLVDFDPTIGHEIQKTRPALIIQNNIANRYSPITIVAAITSKFDKPYPTEVIFGAAEGGLPQRSERVKKLATESRRLREKNRKRPETNDIFM